eukprot:c20521_g1_i1.p1 GENE.c20521_g1_i1~~c20521_g1_i1.p1  ORF type:complete len:633 (+),score=217.46 c20521_g1_i1:2-1900(+)
MRDQYMRKGKFDEGAACLRMKMDMDSENYNFYDLVAYRIKFCPHPHIGDRWCIYPTYDYTHCIIDSLEDIEYSICTLEFETRRESYYWVLDVLDLYRPKVYEFARLNLTHVALSKRKLLKLVVSGYMRGWDDPRMPTIKGLRRRGYTSKMLNDFCQSIGVTRNKTLIQYDRLQNQARAELNLSAPRTMAVLNPIKLVITNLPANHKETISVPLFPFDKESKNREAVFSSIVYIDAKDFRENGDSNYFGLTPGGCLGLRYTNAVIFKELIKGDDGQIIEIRVEADVEKKSSPKAWVHWVSDLNKKECEIRLYNHLFVPEVVDDVNWEDQLNPNSEVVISKALVDSSIGSPAAGQHYQFEREGYFVVDRDSTSNKLVFNQTVSLSEAVSKKKESDSSNSRKLDMIKQVAEKQKKMSIDPKEMFKSETDKYSQFDEDGVPTHDAEGAPLAKSGIKKLRKEWEKQKRLFEQGTVPENWKNLVKDEKSVNELNFTPQMMVQPDTEPELLGSHIISLGEGSISGVKSSITKALNHRIKEIDARFTDFTTDISYVGLTNGVKNRFYNRDHVQTDSILVYFNLQFHGNAGPEKMTEILQELKDYYISHYKVRNSKNAIERHFKASEGILQYTLYFVLNKA